MPGFRKLAVLGMAATGLMLGLAASPAPAAARVIPAIQGVMPEGPQADGAELLLVHDHWRRRHYHRPPPRHYYGPPRRHYYHPPPRAYYRPPPRYYRPPPPPVYYRPPPGYYRY
ncbi:hypothetical protein [Pseudoroseomonas cervicalis]|uniref:hypothetical protein n=1 Tax=Teichococcus cervicalis TaxID=204525 RepID=UPI0022F163F0|nr:hypothetical protein [Pseudoroseomonas cervicalis]WBV42391.1 hypothetical protein PFY06_14255 [Pseudoroseomonas cervicalis]